MKKIIILAVTTMLTTTVVFGASADPKADRLWKAKCASCHGEDGKAQTTQGKKMAVSDFSTAGWQSKFKDQMIQSAIQNGLKRDKGGKRQEMDAYSAKLKPEQIDSLVSYVRSLKK